MTFAAPSRSHLPPTRLPALGAAALLFLLATAACGDAPAEDPAGSALEGAPQWRAVREEGPAGGDKLALQCRSPCRVRLRLALPDEKTEGAPWRVLGAGQTIQVWWSVTPMPASALPRLVHPGASEAGRTKAQAAVVKFQFEDRAFAYHPFAVWTRPGLGRLLHLEAVPPGTYDPLELPGSLELATVVVTDLAKGRAELKRREPLNRLVLPGELAKGDRTRILRLFLDVAPLEDAR